MIPGLSAVDHAAYVTALRTDCEIAWQIQQLDLNHKLMGEIDTVDLDGQINGIAMNGDGIVKTMQATFLDPEHLLRVDGPSPREGVGGMDRLIRVRSLVYSEAEDRWIRAPAGVFWPGGGDEMTRDGDTIVMSAAAKESLHLRTVPPWSIKEGTNWVRAVRRILARGGETHFRFPAGKRSAGLGSTAHIGGDNEDRQPWKVARRIARQHGYQLFYDVTGYACLRQLPGTSIWNLVEHGENANTLTRVKTTTNLREAVNRVVIRGTKGSKVKTGVASSAPSHPQSARSLRHGGQDYIMQLYEDAPDLKTQAEVNRRARARLAEKEALATRVETTTFAFWHWEPMDLWKLEPVNAAAFKHRPLDLSAPMGPSDVGMSVGFNTRVRRATAGRLRP